MTPEPSDHAKKAAATLMLHMRIDISNRLGIEAIIQTAIDRATAEQTKKLRIVTADRNGLMQVNERHRAEIVTAQFLISAYNEEGKRLNQKTDISDSFLARTAADYAALVTVSRERLAELEADSEKAKDLAHFVQEITLVLQSSREKTPEDFDRHFHAAYALYAKYDLDGTQKRNAATQPEGPK